MKTYLIQNKNYFITVNNTVYSISNPRIFVQTFVGFLFLVIIEKQPIVFITQIIKPSPYRPLPDNTTKIVPNKILISNQISTFSM